MPECVRVQPFIGGAFEKGGATFELRDKYLDTVLAEVETATAANVVRPWRSPSAPPGSRSRRPTGAARY